MKKLVSLSLLLFFVCLLIPSWGSAQGQQNQKKRFSPTAKYAPGEIIVKFRGDVNVDAQTASVSKPGIQSLTAKNKIKSIRPFFKKKGSMAAQSNNPAAERLNNLHVLEFDASADVASLIRQFKADPDVEYAEPNYIIRLNAVPNDPSYSVQYGLSRIQAPAAWDIETGKSSIVVAVIDTGIDAKLMNGLFNAGHPDLVNNLWNNEPYDGIDNDRNGFVDDTVGYNFVGSADTENNLPIDFTGHGTHVAGIIGAVGNNSVGIAGVTWNTRLMAVQVLDIFGQGTIDDVVQGIKYAVDEGAHVLNMSFGLTDGSDPTALRDAVAYATTRGRVVVAAAGNNPLGTVVYPAGYPDVISVAAVDSSDRRWIDPDPEWGTNYGFWVDVSAPGVDIYSTLPTYDLLFYDIPLNYGRLTGTSMAAPHVSGLAALLLSKDPTLSVARVTELIKNNTDNIDALNPGFAEKLGTGRINAFRSLSALAPPVSAPVIATQPLDITATAGDSVTFNIAADGVQPISYQWRKNGVVISGATSASYTTPPVTSLDNKALFMCVVSNSVGSVTSRSAKLTVVGVPVITQQPENLTVQEGMAAFFAVTAVGYPAPNYQWRKNGENIPGATSAAYSIPSASISDNAATFSCLVWNSVGRVTSSQVTLTVTRTYGVLQFAVDAYSADENSGVVKVTVNRVRGASGRVQVRYATEDGSAKAGSDFEAIPLPSPSPSASPSPAVLTFEEGETSKTFDVKLINDNLYELTETLQLRLSDPTGGATLGTPAVATLTIYDDDPIPALPAVAITPAGFDPTLGETVVINIEMTTVAQVKLEVINEEYQVVRTLINRILGSRHYGLGWDGKNAAGEVVPYGVYAVRTTVGPNHRDDTVEVFERSRFQLPQITRQPINQTVTAGRSATFSVGASGYPMLSYQWRRNGIDIPGATSSNYTTPPTELLDSGSEFKCLVTNVEGSIESSAALLTVDPAFAYSNDEKGGFVRFKNKTAGPVDIKIESQQVQPFEIRIMTSRGQMVRTLNGTAERSSEYLVHWDGRNDKGEKVASDIYLLMLKMAGKTQTKKVAIVR